MSAVRRGEDGRLRRQLDGGIATKNTGTSVEVRFGVAPILRGARISRRRRPHAGVMATAPALGSPASGLPGDAGRVS